MGTWESYGIFEIYWDVHGKELLDAAKFAVYVLNVATEAPQNEVSSFFDLVRSQLVVENRTIVLNHHKNVLFHSGATPMGRYLMFRSVLHGCLCALGPRQILYLEMTANWPSTNYEALLRRLRSRVYDVKKATSFNVVSDGRDDWFVAAYTRSQATFGSGIQVDVVGGVITWNDVHPSFINKPDKKPESKL